MRVKGTKQLNSSKKGSKTSSGPERRAKKIKISLQANQTQSFVLFMEIP